MEFEFLKSYGDQKIKYFPGILTVLSLLFHHSKSSPDRGHLPTLQILSHAAFFDCWFWRERTLKINNFFFFSFNTLHTTISSSFPSEVSHFIKVISFLNIFVSSLKIRNFRYFPLEVPFFFLKIKPDSLRNLCPSFF